MFVALVKAKTANRKIRGEHDEGEKKVADSFKVSTFGHFVFFLVPLFNEEKIED